MAAIDHDLADAGAGLSAAGAFGILRRHLGVRKGGLLLPVPEQNAYFPWVTIGFDPTTRHLLRWPMPTEGVYTRMTHITENALKEVRGAFSNHDFKQLSEVWLLPLTAKGHHVGVALIGESAMDRLDPDSRGILFSSVARLVATRITQPERGDLQTLPARGVVLGADGLAEEAERLIRGGHASLVVVEINVEAAVQAIVEHQREKSDDATDRYRLAQEITRMIATMLAVQAHIGTTREGRTIAVLPADSNTPLLFHQIAQGLRKVFPEMASPPSLLKGRVTWDTATTDFADTLEALSPDT